MKFKVIDPATQTNIMGEGPFPADHPQIISAAPVSDSYPEYTKLEVGQSGMYECRMCGCKTTVQILRVE